MSAPVTADLAVVAARELVVVVGRLLRRLRAMRDESGLSPSQASVLSRLDKQGAATASALAAAEGVRPQSMAATVAALLDLGLVRRDPDPDDGRRHLLSLSDAGLAHLGQQRQNRDEWLVSVLRADLSEAELATVVEALALIERATSR